MERDTDLYLAFLEGDESAFERLMVRYQASLTYFCYRYTKDLHAAEDLAIDAFCYILMHPRRFRIGTEFKTYLYMLAKSRCIDHLRKQKRHVSLESIGEEVPCDEEALEELVLKSEIHRAVHRALKQLPQDMQTAVHLIYFEALSYQDAAIVMNKSPKQVDNLLYRAKGELKRILGKEGEELL